MSLDQPPTDPVKEQTIKEQTSDHEKKQRLRWILIITAIVLSILAFIGSGIAAGLSLANKAQERFDDDDNPVRIMVDAAFGSASSQASAGDLWEAECKMLMAEKSLATRDYAGAHKHFARARELFESCLPDSYVTAGFIARIGGFEYDFAKYKEAELDFRDALKAFKKTDPSMHPFHTELWLAYTLVEEGKRKEAIDLSQQILDEARGLDKSHMSNAPHVLSALRLLAYAQGHDKQDTSALQTYETLLSNMDKQVQKPPPRAYAKVFIDMAYLERKLDHYEKGIGYCDKAISVDPQNIDTYRTRAVLSGDSHKTDAQLSDLNRCVELDPKDAWTYVQRGHVFKELKQRDKAVSDFTQALVLDPSYDYARYQRGVLFEDLKQYDKAIDDLSKAIENQLHMKTPNETMDTWLTKHAYVHRASVYDAMSKPELAGKDRKLAAQIKDDP